MSTNSIIPPNFTLLYTGRNHYLTDLKEDFNEPLPFESVVSTNSTTLAVVREYTSRLRLCQPQTDICLFPGLIGGHFYRCYIIPAAGIERRL